MRSMLGLALALSGAMGAVADINPLDSVAGVSQTLGRPLPVKVELVKGEGLSADAGGAIRFEGTSPKREGNDYFAVMIPFGQPLDLRQRRLLLDARTDHPQHTQAFYIRLYNRGENKPALSFSSWDSRLKENFTTFTLQPGLTFELAWEAAVVEDRVPDRIDRMEVIVGTSDDEVPISVTVDRLRSDDPIETVQGLKTVKPLVRETLLVEGGQAQAVVLHPDTDAGRAAAAVVVDAVRTASGATLTMRP
ncbi:MAG: hypothetical protein HUU35_19725, partial [Armatimonadetes bacterium]|nr:hypothetical protein [Armatimonadota bacterium]